ncbi:hypothetical protein ACFR9U_01610 [Halorientalis brevis]|uniref:DUF2795 domain-containing protein n=1 Tax=Halorientalis brevis TaxID=1126241 RepID=A0ABD6C7C2_9EURY|nr:hypothetical protein [Halorientalis brevis]
MGRTTKLNELRSLVAELHYPLDCETASEAVDDVTLQLADGTKNLGAVIADSNADAFETAEELETEVRNLLPRRAVGEPYQSEGEG